MHLRQYCTKLKSKPFILTLLRFSIATRRQKVVPPIASSCASCRVYYHGLPFQGRTLIQLMVVMMWLEGLIGVAVI